MTSTTTCPQRPSWGRIWRGVGYGATVLAPLFLLLDLRAGFLRDWPVHIWIIDYFAAYFRGHGDLPTVINALPAVGIAQPVYYGVLLYPFLGILSALLGSALALRLALVVMLAIQFAAIFSAGRRIFGHRGLAYTAAVTLVWSTYSLTNLYSRGAIAEYFGTGFYVTGLAFGASAATAPETARRFSAWAAGFFLLLAVGTHPPTAVLTALFIVLLGLVLVVGGRRGRWPLSASDTKFLTWGVGLGALVLAPWIYANLAPGTKLAIAQTAGGFNFRPDHSDTFWGRFGLLPYDASSVEAGINTMGAPYLETQISIVLLGLLLWNLALLRRCRNSASPEILTSDASSARSVLGVAIAWFVFLATFSLSPWLAGHFQFLAPYIQYVYRLVSHCNAALLVALFASGVLVARQRGYLRFQLQTEVVVAAGLTAAILGLVLKLQHSAAVAAWDEGRVISLIGGQTDIARDYEVPGLVRELRADEFKTTSSVSFPVSTAGRSFGEVGPVRITPVQPGWVQTNGLIHPWLKLECDDRILRPNELAQIGHFLVVHLPAGPHRLRLIWQPDTAWLVLRRISQAAFVVMLVITFVVAALELRSTSRLGSVRATEP